MSRQNNSTSSNGESASSDHTLMNRVYKEKKIEILRQLEQLKDGTHPEYVKKLKEFEDQKNNELLMNNFWRDSVSENIESEYVSSSLKIHSDFKKQEFELENAKIEELNDRKKAIMLDHENNTICMDFKKLRRRTNGPPIMPVSNSQDKRRKASPLPVIQYLLSDSDIESDLKEIQESSRRAESTSFKQELKMGDNPSFESVIKSEFLQYISSSSNNKHENIDTEESLSVINTRIEDGKLLFEKRWYHRGQPVFVEGTNTPKFSAVILSIGNDFILVKKTSDSTKVCIKLSCLSTRNMSIKRRSVF